MKPDSSISHPGAVAGVAGLAAGSYLIQRRFRSRIAADPLSTALAREPRGRAIGVRSADGTMLHAEVFGRENADARTIVLAHGWTEAIRLWTFQIEALAPDFRVVAYDQRGHGRSHRAHADDYSLARLGEDLEAVLDACVPAGERAILCGHLMGAMSIAAWAADHDVESRAAAAALVNTGVASLIDEHKLLKLPFDAALRGPFARRAFLGNPAPLPRYPNPITSAVVKYVAFARSASPAAVAFFAEMYLECDPKVRAACGLEMANMDLAHALPQLAPIPTLVMAGDSDRLTPPVHAERMAQAIGPNTKLVVLPDTGHLGPIERPDAYSAALRELAGRVPAQLTLAAA
jgi:pimeloyl-ACP methyl ester carboxylesterase